MSFRRRLREYARRWHRGDSISDRESSSAKPLRADGGEKPDEEQEDQPDEKSDVDRSSIDVTEAGEAEPADPKWKNPDMEDIPEFEVQADKPTAGGGNAPEMHTDDQGADPTAGMPNTARSPGQSRIKEEGTEGYIVALELCARLPDDVRLPEEAADLVPAAVEAELEEDIRSFAAAEFDNQNPHVQTLAFEEVDDEIWMRLRLGIPSEAFDELDPETIRSHALQQLEGMF